MTNIEDDGTKLALDADIPWAPMGPEPDGGVDIKIFRVNHDQQTIAFMNRFQPGFQALKHKHLGEVNAYTLQGRWHYLEYDWISSAGDYVYEEAGTVHTLEALPDNTEPTVVFFVVQGGLEIIDDDDNVFMTVDAQGFEDLYKMGLDSLELPYPGNILR